jgi:hypothetical protein
MEALLEKEGTVENWNDERMDELARRMDDGFREMREGFARADREMKEGFAEVDAKFDTKFDRLGTRIDKLIFTTMATGGAFAATAFAALVKVAFFG